MRNIVITGALALAATSTVASAATLFSDNFKTNTSAAYTVNNGPGNNDATFAYDYSAVGIPAAPGNSDTLGLRLRANLAPVPTPAVQGGISVSPIGQSFAGDYTVRFNAWQNYPGPLPAGGSGSTQLLTYAVGTAGTTPQRPGSTLDGVMFATTGDGGSGDDYRIYGPGATGAQVDPAAFPGTYAAGNTTAARNNTNAYYSSFGNKAAPAAQLALYPTQTGNSAVGTQGFAWHDVTLVKVGNKVLWNIDGIRIGTVDLAAMSIILGGGNISLGYSDVNTSVSSADQALNIGLIDNLIVTDVVPEPTTLTVLGGAATLLLRRRK